MNPWIALAFFTLVFWVVNRCITWPAPSEFIRNLVNIVLLIVVTILVLYSGHAGPLVLGK